MAWLPPLLIGIFASLLIQVYFIYQRKKLKLKPNCLLTRHPLVFLTTSEAPILLRRFLNKATYPHIWQLSEHGYETLQLSWPQTAHPKRFTKMTQMLEKIKSQFGQAHFIIPPEIESDFYAFKMQVPSNLLPTISSLTITNSQNIKDHLNIAISLAENDFQCSH